MPVASRATSVSHGPDRQRGFHPSAESGETHGAGSLSGCASYGSNAGPPARSQISGGPKHANPTPCDDDGEATRAEGVHRGSSLAGLPAKHPERHGGIDGSAPVVGRNVVFVRSRVPRESHHSDGDEPARFAWLGEGLHMTLWTPYRGKTHRPHRP